MIERLGGKKFESVEEYIYSFKNRFLKALDTNVNDEGINNWRFESTLTKPNERTDRYVYSGNQASKRKNEEWKAVKEAIGSKYEYKLIKHVKIKNGYFVRAIEFGLRDNFFIEYSEYVLKKDRNDIITIQAPTDDISKAEALIIEMPNPRLDAIERSRMFAGNYYHSTPALKEDTKIVSIASHPLFRRK